MRWSKSTRRSPTGRRERVLSSSSKAVGSSGTAGRTVSSTPVFTAHRHEQARSEVWQPQTTATVCPITSLGTRSQCDGFDNGAGNGPGAR
jgi:hypothetical protein